MTEVVTKDKVDLRKKKAARALLIVGLVLSIVENGLSILFFIIAWAIFLIVGGFAAVLGALFSGGNSEAANNASTNAFASLGWLPILSTTLVLLTMLAIVLAIVALVIFSKAKTKKKGIVAGVFAVISGAMFIIVPVELIGGIFAFLVTDEQYATPLPKMKKKKDNGTVVEEEVLDLTEKETNE